MHMKDTCTLGGVFYDRLYANNLRLPFRKPLQGIPPQEYYWHYTRLAEKQESALLETLSESQWELLEQYQTTRNTMHSHELEAMFLAAWKTSRELA